MFENLVNQKCRETNIRNILLSRRFENLVNQECRETAKTASIIALSFENLVNQECRETAKTASIIALSFESLVNQEYRTLNIYICNQIHGEHPQPTKTKIWRVLSNPTKGVYKRERPPCNEPILSRKNLKVNTNTMTPTNQGVFL